jgi:hypothetical protein
MKQVAEGQAMIWRNTCELYSVADKIKSWLPCPDHLSLCLQGDSVRLEAEVESQLWGQALGQQQAGAVLA